MDRIAGGLPRAFGFPLVALFLYGLLNDKFRLNYIVIILSSLFYPPLILTMFIAIFLKNIFNTNYKFFSTWKGLVFTLVLTILILMPNILTNYKYDGFFKSSIYKTLPEFSNNGRFLFYDTNLKSFFYEVVLLETYKIFAFFNDSKLLILPILSLLAIFIKTKFFFSLRIFLISFFNFILCLILFLSKILHSQ